jgi:hypothetical protein
MSPSGPQVSVASPHPPSPDGLGPPSPAVRARALRCAASGPLPHCAGLSGENFAARITCVRPARNDFKSSCADLIDLIRASTSFFGHPEAWMPTDLVRGLKAHGPSPAKTKFGRRFPFPSSSQDFPGQPCAMRETVPSAARRVTAAVVLSVRTCTRIAVPNASTCSTAVCSAAPLGEAELRPSDGRVQ